MRILQAIDIGTNSVRSIVAEAPDGASSLRVIDDEKVTVRLGEGLLASGEISDAAIERTIDALRPMIEIGDSLGVTERTARATAAARIARNSDEFRARLRDALGVEVEVVSEEEEGRLVFLSAAANFDMAGKAGVIDIGGGSVEVVLSTDGQVEQIVSLELGARVLAEAFVTGDPMPTESFRAMRKAVRKRLRAALGTPPAISTLVGSGGTVTSAAGMTLAARGRRVETLQGVELDRNDLVRLLAILRHSTAEERRAVPGLPPERVDIILPGVVVLFEAMRLLDAERLSVNARGIREGILLDMIGEEASWGSGGAFDRMAAVRRFGDRCRCDTTHAEQVTRLALALFDELAGSMSLEPADRDLLEAAGLIHDVGYLIAYDKHHKHSYHLIVHAGLPGFSDREQRLIAAIARYHTKGLPKSKHEAMQPLDREDRLRVQKLAAMLRLADGLDRSRGSAVEHVSVEDDGLAVRVEARGHGPMHAEAHGAASKKDLLERVIGRPVVTIVEPTGDGPTTKHPAVDDAELR